eukprot:m.738774 g.738774  ORF g.738774 m.738774 type:complete len:563 (+) comp58912_c1_seq4:482-2170(+)
MSSEVAGVEGMHAVMRANNTLAVTWQRPQAPGSEMRAIFYKVFLSEAGNPSSERKVLDGKDVYEYESGRLQPLTAYTVKVYAYRPQIGQSVPAQATLKTFSPPNSAPTSVTSTLEGDGDSIRVVWAVPANLETSFSGYKIFMDRLGDNKYLELDLPPTQTEMTFPNLDFDSIYRHQLLVFNEHGDGPCSDLILTQTFLTAKKRALRLSTKRSGPAESVEAASTAAVIAPVVVKEEPAAPLQSFEHTNLPQKITWKKVSKPEPIPEATVAEPPKAKVSAEQIEKMKTLQRRHSDVLQQAAQTSMPQKTTVDVSEFERTVSRGVGVSATQDDHREALRSTISRTMSSNRTRDVLDEHLGEHASELLRADDPIKFAGTIRGKKHGVRAALGAFQKQSEAVRSELHERLYQEEKDNIIVVYMTSLQTVRTTFDNCNAALKMFSLYGVKVRVKDAQIDPKFQKELTERLERAPNIELPQIFINAVHIGGLAQLIELNDSGSLRKLIEGFAGESVRCSTCGGAAYINCTWCQGSKKSLQHAFEVGSRNNVLKCTICNNNGLMRCPTCS